MILLKLEETKLKIYFYALKHTHFVPDHTQKKKKKKFKWKNQVYLKHKYTHSCKHVCVCSVCTYARHVSANVPSSIFIISNSS